MALDDLPSWARRMSAEVRRLLDGFEERFGYEPDTNEIGLTTDDRGVGTSDLPPQVRAFFQSIDEVSLPDVWNGYFLGPADLVIRCFNDNDPGAVVVNSEEHRAMSIGSDGGGAYFAIDLDAGGAMLRVSEATVKAGALRGNVQQVAPDFDTFLEVLCDNISAVARGEEPTF